MNATTILDLVRGNELDRTTMGVAGVDSGTMAIGDQGSAWSGWLDGYAEVTERGVVCTSGLGDGVYDVLAVTYRDRLVGVEVVFIDPTMSEAVDEAAGAAGVDLNDPGAYNAFFEANPQLDELITCSDPNRDGVLENLGRFTARSLGVGDPAVGLDVLVPGALSGEFLAVVWRQDLDVFGTRNLRVGVYSLEN